MPGRYRSAGQRDRLITIEQVTETLGPSSFPVEGWSPLVTGLLAAREAEGGDEIFAADQVSGAERVRWTIPYRADCDPELVAVVKTRRIVAEGRIYDITAGEPIGYKAAFALQTRAKVG
jgi:head-tail adaptor